MKLAEERIEEFKADFFNLMQKHKITIDYDVDFYEPDHIAFDFAQTKEEQWANIELKDLIKNQ